MERVMADTLGRSRFSAQLLALFAALALALAAVGLYGVMSYAVNLRTRELGLRAALGAEPAGLLALVLRQGLRLTLLGIGLGLAGALALTRLLASLLYGVDASDPVTFAAIALLLAAVAGLACYLPARRAARMEPLVALRYE
jgi:putative ABC transport system permease protein